MANPLLKSPDTPLPSFKTPSRDHQSQSCDSSLHSDLLWHLLWRQNNVSPPPILSLSARPNDRIAIASTTGNAVTHSYLKLLSSQKSPRPLDCDKFLCKLTFLLRYTMGPTDLSRTSYQRASEGAVDFHWSLSWNVCTISKYGLNQFLNSGRMWAEFSEIMGGLESE